MSKVNNDAQSEALQTKTQEAADLDFIKQFGTGTLDNLSSKDIVMPRYKLVQNTSKTGTPGKWVSSLDPEKELDKLEIVILAISNFRTYFPPMGESDKPLCRSNDGYRKSDPNGIGDGVCASCRFNVWKKNERTGSVEPPECRAGYTLLCIVELPDGTKEPAMISFKGTAIKPCKTYFTKMKGRGVAPFTYITVIEAVSEVNQKGRFFKPSFSFGRTLSKDEILYAAEQAKLFQNFITADFVIDAESEERTASPQTSAADNFINELNGDGIDVSKGSINF